MAPRLNQVLTFAGVAPGDTVALPFQLNVGPQSTPVKPDIIFRDNGDFSIVSCTATVLTVKNNGTGVETLNAWLWHQHTFDREYGASAVTNLNPQPFIPAAGGGGGGGGSLAVQLDEVDVVNPATVLDFQSPGILVEVGDSLDAAKIWSTLVPPTDVFTPGEGGVVNCIIGQTNLIDAADGASARLPLADSLPSGAFCIVKMVTTGHHDGDPSGPIDFRSHGEDTIDGYSSGFPFTLDLIGASAVFITDGDSNWSLVAVYTPGSTAPPIEQDFYQPVDSATDPNSFDIALPADMADDQYVVQLTLQPATADGIVEVALLAKTIDTITVCATSNYEDGTIIHVSIKEKTGGP